MNGMEVLTKATGSSSNILIVVSKPDSSSDGVSRECIRPSSGFTDLDVVISSISRIWVLRSTCSSALS